MEERKRKCEKRRMKRKLKNTVAETESGNQLCCFHLRYVGGESRERVRGRHLVVQNVPKPVRPMRWRHLSILHVMLPEKGGG